ncbi:Tfp pilus assembly protein PilW [Streptomyces turgidiscabies]|uniref:Tfp pilus assembly protein PilW n=1 Tax=Streptomyces turgidiscabies TaxID=85558 RepID=A0ABU0RJR9_9ACTN|nr:Tfp pilus assembly protein PilW [Streptomyces turgidiscabies]
MSAAHRSLLTATAAGVLLGALWFVPSADATTGKSVERQHRVDTSMSTMSDFTRQISVTNTHKSPTTSTSSSASTSTSGSASNALTSASTTTSDSAADDGTRLADTGSFDTTPYMVGGTFCLSLGAGFVVYSLRRERLGF